MLTIGAKVNNFYDIHKGTLLLLKKQIWKAKNNYSFAVSQKYSRFRSKRVFAKMLESMKLKKAKRESYLSDTIEQIDIIIDELDYSKEVKPLKLIGLKATNELLTTVYATMFSLLILILQTFYGDLTS
mmetsp:Transcript_8634/g.7651  ORF Transcript_8634/g.7651 Transcript_8634/m.7651 type:complete len:128 (+) Transcript_8634:609-992(+)